MRPTATNEDSRGDERQAGSLLNHTGIKIFSSSYILIPLVLSNDVPRKRCHAEKAGKENGKGAHYATR